MTCEDERLEVGRKRGLMEEKEEREMKSAMSSCRTRLQTKKKTVEGEKDGTRDII